MLWDLSSLKIVHLNICVSKTTVIIAPIYFKAFSVQLG